MISNFLSLNSQAILAAIFIYYIIYRNTKKLPIPTIRVWPSIFPEFLDRLSYANNAAQLVEQGYNKVSYFSL